MSAIWCPKCYYYFRGFLEACNGCKELVDPSKPDSEQIPPTRFKPNPYKVRKETNKMIVTIIGSYSQKDKMLEAKKFFERFGHEVNCPCDPGRENYSLVEKQGEWIDKICHSDLIVAIEKELYMSGEAGKTDYILKFGESTSYEIATALYFKKQIVFW